MLKDHARLVVLEEARRERKTTEYISTGYGAEYYQPQPMTPFWTTPTHKLCSKNRKKWFVAVLTIATRSNNQWKARRDAAISEAAATSLSISPCVVVRERLPIALWFMILAHCRRLGRSG